jgi:hypothetical protein
MCFAKVTILISVVQVVNEVFGAVAAYFVQSRCACASCTVQNSFCTKYAATAPKTSLTTRTTEINIVTLAKHRL